MKRYTFVIGTIEMSVPAEEWDWIKKEIGIDDDKYVFDYLFHLGVKTILAMKGEKK